MTKSPASDEAFYTAIGRAITEWACVEQSLFRIFLSALDGADPHAASAGFYGVLAFSSKLDMTSAALQVRLGRNPLTSASAYRVESHPVLDRWVGFKGGSHNTIKSLQGQISAHAKERNKLAHYVVTMNHVDSGVRKPELRKTPYNASNTDALFDD